jgi:hypothetical protein
MIFQVVFAIAQLGRNVSVPGRHARNRCANVKGSSLPEKADGTSTIKRFLVREAGSYEQSRNFCLLRGACQRAAPRDDPLGRNDDLNDRAVPVASFGIQADNL